MNRAVQKLHRRRCALKNTSIGGGLLVNPDAPIVSDNGVPYPDNQYYSECYTETRPGALASLPNPELAQTPMAGGYNAMSAAQLLSLAGKRGGSLRSRRACGCGMRSGMRGGACPCMSRRQQGGQCGKPEVAWLGGRRRTRKQKGGNKGGYELDVTQNVGGMGPIAEPARVAVPCDARAGMQNPFTATPASPDPRAPAFGYSLTPNMSGGGNLSERIPNFEYAQTMMGGKRLRSRIRSRRHKGGNYGGNAYPASCYKAPGSEMPVYPATSAGFHFTPSTEAGATLPDGITAYNEVVASVARLGGAYRRKRSTKRSTKRSYRKKHRDTKKTGKTHRKSRRSNRK